MKEVVLLLGGNLGERQSFMQRAENELEKKFSIVKKSVMYESAAWSGDSEGDYLNRAMIIATDKEPSAILSEIQEIEDLLERKRDKRWGDRTMDIDIIYIDELVIETETLTVPHPLIQDRKFVLLPVCELMPAFVHPVLGKTNAQLLEGCEDFGEVWVFEQ